MMMGEMMQQKEIFEKYFKHDFLLLVNDRVDNVRLNVAKVLRHHFLKEISGIFVYDEEFNNAIKLLKQDKCEDVRCYVADIETYPINDNKVVEMESFLSHIESLK